MGRRKKQVDIEDAIADKDADEKRKNSTLTEDEQRALLFQHKGAYEKALADKKAADARLKNVCKIAKAELGKGAVADIKDAIALEQPEGEAAHRAEIERQLRIARWMGASVRTQFSFSEDMTPSVDRAYEEGKRAGLKGDPASPPHDPSVPQYGKWMEGWHAGQGVLASDFRKKIDMPSEAEEAAPINADVPEFHAAAH